MTDEVSERIATALEAIAERLQPVDPGVAQTAATFMDLLKDVVQLIENSQSTDEEWMEMLEEIKDTVGLT